METTDAGYVSVELEQLVLTLPLVAPELCDEQGDLSVRVDFELLHHADVFKWSSSASPKSSTSVFKAVRQASVEDDAQPNPDVQLQPEEESGAGAEAELRPSPPTSFLLAFPSMTLRTTFIDLNVEVVSALCNVVLVARVVTLSGDGSKEDVQAELTLPLFALLTAPGAAIIASSTFTELSSPPALSVSAGSSLQGEASSLVWKVLCDNDLSEYCVGCAVLQIETASLSAPPAAWGLHYADVLDPKAKVQPTEADLRARYLENIPKLVEAQAKLAQFTLSIGGAPQPAADATADVEANSNADAEAVSSVMSAEELLPPLQLAGTISFDAAAAAALPLETDIRSVGSIWAISWPESSKILLTRHQLRSLKASLTSKSSLLSVSVPVTVSKIVTTEGTAAEGPSLNACGLVDISSLAKVNILQSNLVCELAGQGFETTSAVSSVGVSEEKGEGGEEETAEDARPVGPTCTISLSLSRPLVSSAPSLPPSVPVTRPQRAWAESVPGDRVAGGSEDSEASSVDVLADLRTEIASVVKAIALEYMVMYPSGLRNDPDSHLADRKAEFLYYLSTNGAYHAFKESLKPKIQRVVRHLYGPRGQALGRSTATRNLNTSSSATAGDEASVLDKVLAELYVVLVKESNAVMNGLLKETIIKKDELEQESGAKIAPSSAALGADDETESALQKFARLLSLADDAESDLRRETAESWHLERILLARNTASLSASGAALQHGYDCLGRFYLRQAAAVLSQSASLGVGRGDEAISLISKAREALGLAVSADDSPKQWRTSLLLATLLIEQGQESGLERMLKVLKSQASVEMGTFDEFDGYESDKLCSPEVSGAGVVVDPLFYAILAGVFTQMGNPVRARKALRLANKCFALGQHNPPLATHGSPKRTLVLLLARASLFLSEHALGSLSEACYNLAVDCEAAVTAKAHAKDLSAVTPPFIRCLVKRAHAQVAALGLASGTANSSIEAAQEAVLVATDPLDVVDAHLAVAVAAATVSATSSTRIQTPALALDSLLAAITAATNANVTSHVPVAAYLQACKLLLQSQRVAEAYTVAATACTAKTTPSLMLQMGVCCLKQERLQDCEDALQEANLLDNRNALVWAYLTLLCLSSGSSRLQEAEACLYQSLRLGLRSTTVLRELGTAFMSLDKLAIAEDLIRRALSEEQAQSSDSKQNPHYRKLLGDVLAGQQQAARAVEEYKTVLGSEAEADTKLQAAERCLALLETLGRAEEAAAVKEILSSLRDAVQLR